MCEISRITYKGEKIFIVWKCRIQSVSYITLPVLRIAPLLSMIPNLASVDRELMGF